MEARKHPGFRLKKVIADHGLKYEWLAPRLGIGRPTLSLITNGRQKITPEIALAIVKEFGTESGTAWEWFREQIEYDMHQTQLACDAKLAALKAMETTA